MIFDRRSLAKVLQPHRLEVDDDAPKATRPPAGWDWNPLRAFPRNQACFCGSEKKAKRCCLPRQGACVKEKDAAFLKKNWGKIEAGLLKVTARAPQEL